MVKFKIILSLCFFLACSAQAQNNIPLRASEETFESLVGKYANQGVVAAQKLKAEFALLDKPKFQKAYSEYLKDLQIISETGNVPDNQELYNDLLEMNSNDYFVYKTQKGSIRAGFGHILGTR